MCGIIGYIGNKNAIPILIDGLKKLEYRGYDSAGISVSKDAKIHTIKKKGEIAEFEKHPDLINLSANIGIAHTRWATHGKPSKENAHPHTDCLNNISIVHNGIIENYHSLKDMLIKEGHVFKSETDSEVIAHLIEKFYHNDLEQAVTKSLELIEGAFGLVILHKDSHQLIATKKGSPLIIGVGEQEIFIASDVPAILKHTQKVIYLQDNEIAILTPSKYDIKNILGIKSDPKIHNIKWSIDQIEKKGHKHFMLKEILEQPESISNTIRGRIKNNKIKLTINTDISSINRFIITACGTSWHASLIGKYYIENLTRIPVEVDYASEFRYRNPIIQAGDTLIAVSQSGETADTLAAIKEAKDQGANTLGIVNIVGSTIAREVHSGIYIHAGPEIGVASTKAFTGQVTTFLLLALYLRQVKGLSLDKKLLNEIEQLPQKIEATLKLNSAIKKIAQKYKDAKNFLYLGRSLNFPTALEGALKLKEISYIHAEGYPAAEMKHGSIALIDKDMPVFFIATSSDILDKTISNIQEVKARGGRVITIIDKPNKTIEKLSNHIIPVPKVHEYLSPIINTIPTQLFSYHMADIRGLNVDKPRNLAKSVTIE